ncbi:universal stress protein [Klenkia taihuensis]|uniref:Universal stress protein family protein n=1 Tax=Klenkia taihuensis TaxID=1225127 RepID=A0A1I1R4K3_9ACTN|nr:universal stress protein [Klenkia taihuensis]GHE07251.1 hypothetical protein GCM10011381_02600 [Klenkia taihuensis]SFD29276.1 Universal stress protein family protein [Klenkia taihuensis]
MTAPVVIAVNDRPEGVAALHWGLKQARRLQTSAVLVASTGDTPSAPVHLSTATRELIASAAEGVDHVLHDQPDDVAQTLITLSEDADMVVLPVRRRSVTMKFLLGSNAMRVIAEAHCPVVTVKSPA